MEVKTIAEYPIGSRVSVWRNLLHGTGLGNCNDFHFITGKIVQRGVVEDISCMRPTNEPRWVKEIVIAIYDDLPSSFVHLHPDTLAAPACTIAQAQEFCNACVKYNLQVEESRGITRVGD